MLTCPLISFLLAPNSAAVQIVKLIIATALSTLTLAIPLNAFAHDQEAYFEPLAYIATASYVAPQRSPLAACNHAAAIWKWDVNGYSVKLEPISEALWKCQRYYLGTKEEGWYYRVTGLCQISPTPIIAGKPWSHPQYNYNKRTPCYCNGGSKFNYQDEWCDSPESNVADPSLQLGNTPSTTTPTACSYQQAASATGNNFTTESDSLSGSNSISFSRHYNSIDGKWRHSYSTEIIASLKTITVIHSNGRHEYLSRANSNLDFTNTLSRITQTPEGKFIYSSSLNETMTFSNEGSLEKIQSPQTPTKEIKYLKNKLLVSQNGNTLELSIGDSGEVLLARMGSRAWKYSYSSNGQLTLVDSKSSEGGGSRSFHYEDPRNPNLLTGITDERGIRYATWTYDDQGRAISSEHAGGAEKVTVAYNADGSSTVTNALGKRATYRFQTIQGIRRITAIEGEPSANCPNSNSIFTYDDRGLVKTRTDNKGNVTTFDYNERGLETSRTEAFGTAQARTVTTTWHPTLFLPATITEPNQTTNYSYDEQGRLLAQTKTSH